MMYSKFTGRVMTLLQRSVCVTKERYVVIKKKSATSSDIHSHSYTQKFSTVLVLAGTDSDKLSLTD